MFMCKYCLQQYEDSQLAYELIPQARLSHPAKEAFYYKFCSKEDLQKFLSDISFQHLVYVLTEKGAGGDKEFPPGTPKDLLLQVGA